MTFNLRWNDLDFVRLLGEGQAGEVWLATLKRAAGGLSIAEHVAVKRYRRWVLQEPRQYERVFRELKASIKVRHPNIVHNICLLSDPEGLPALVMKYYEGTTLESILAEGRSTDTPLPVGRTFPLLAALIDTLSALHAAGIYHRDIKPTNILVDNASGSPILMDLGVVSDFLMPEQTQTTDFLGTIRYASPSYLTGSQFTPESDWYSLGLVAYELFFGRRFLASEEQWARLVAHKVSSQLPTQEDLAENLQRLSEVAGQDAAEAVYYTLTTMLFECTPQSLECLKSAISMTFWTRPHFVGTAGEIVLGEPAKVPAFQFNPSLWRWSHSTTDLETLKEAHSRLLDIVFGREEGPGLPSFLKNSYWKWKLEGLGDLHSPKRDPLALYSFYAGGGGDDTTYDILELNAGIMALFRYGYL